MELKPKVEQTVENETTQSPKGLSPFDFSKNIKNGKEFIFKPNEDEKAYASYIINRDLSLEPDTVLQADEMNRNHQIPKLAQYAFLFNTITKKPRYTKWLKKTKNEDLLVVKTYYGYNNQKAEQALMILTKEQISELESRLDRGGKQ